MRKLLFVLAAFILVACDPDPQPLPDADTTLTRASLGSGSYYVESGAGSRAIAGGSLKYVSAGTLGTVSFTDADGNEASVAVSNALALSTRGLVIEATYLDVTSAYIAPVSGDLVELVPSPDGWDYARDDGTYLYYIADAGLYRAPLATGVGVLMSGADSLSAGAWLKVTSYGGVIYMDWAASSNQTRYLLGADPVTTNAQLPNVLTNNAIEAPDGTVYRIQFAGAGVDLYPFAEWGTDGGYVGGDAQRLCTLPVSTVQENRISSSKVTDSITIAYAGSSDQGGYLRIEATDAGISYSVTSANLDGDTFVTWAATLNVADGETAYHAVYDTADLTLWHLYASPLVAAASRGLGGIPAILSDYNVTALQPLGGLLFYQRDAGSGVQTMVYDGTGVEVYANGAVSIEAVE